MKLQSGDIFASRYKLLKKLGSGAYSEVWCATDTKAGDLKVAIKIFAPDHGLDADGIEVFKNEFKMVFNFTNSFLIHPTSYDVCDGSPFLVLPYCERGSTHQLIGKMDELQAIHFIHDVAAGLEYLHSKELIHQDIKPDNILIDDSGKYMITDFGISTQVRSTLNKNIEEHSSGSAGTLAYMAPERFSKDPRAVKASDIFSLGATVFELITGNPPFGEHGGLILKGGAEIPTLPNTISKELQDLIYRCLSLEPWDRPLASELKDKTAEYLKTGSWTKKEDKSRSILKWAALVLALLLIGGGIWLWDYNRTKIRYYKDYVEVWGVPQGINKLSKNEVSHRNNSYRFEYKNNKLMRMSRVNSKGKVIPHTDSEEKGVRPDDALFTYRKNGKLANVKFRDRNKKVVSKRIYNDNLKTMTFVRDDGYDTEVNVPSRTLAINSDDNDDSKGQISRFLLDYDPQGHVSKLEYSGFQNVKVGDADGIYAKEYKRDKKGRIIEERYLGYDGKPKSTPKGLGVKQFFYDDNDNWVEAKYYTIDMEPSTDENGIPIYRMEVDQWGNPVRAMHYNFQNELTLDSKNNISGAINQYDNNGFVVKVIKLGIDGNPTYTEGWTGLENKYNDNGFIIERKCVGIDGKQTMTEEGDSRHIRIPDENDNDLELWNYDLNGKLAANSTGYAGVKCKYDSIGNMIEAIYYGTDEKPVKADGYNAGFRYTYNPQSQLMEMVYLDEQLNPSPNETGVSLYKYEYDTRGNRIKYSYYDQNGNPVLSTEQLAVITQKYNPQGKIIEKAYWDLDNNLVTGGNKVARNVIEYDDNGYISEWINYDAKGNILNGSIYKSDNRGNTIEYYEIDANRKPASGSYFMKSEYDNHDNQTSLSYFDHKMKPVINSDKYHKFVYVYNDRNQVIEKRYYNTDNKLTNSSNKYAIKKLKYDNQGNEVETTHYNSQEKPCSDENNVYRYVNEFDSQNRIIHQLSFNEEGKPCINKGTAPEGRVKYDNKGNIIELSCYDGHGNLINGNQGYAYEVRTYNDKGKIISSTYLNKDNQMVFNKAENYSKAETDYNELNNITEIRYYDDKNQLNRSPFAYVRYKYDDSGNIIEFAYFNYLNKPCNYSSNGFHKFSFSNFKNGNAQNLKLEDVKGYVEYRKLINGSWQRVDNTPAPTTTVTPTNTATTSGGENLASMIAELKSECPLEVSAGVILTEANLISSNTVSMTFQLTNETIYDLSDETKNVYQQQFSELKRLFLKENFPAGTKLILIVKDKANREIFRL